MTREELKERIDRYSFIGLSLIPDDIIDAGIHLKEFIALVNQGWGDYEEVENRILLNTLDVIQDYFELLEKLRDKIE